MALLFKVIQFSLALIYVPQISKWATSFFNFYGKACLIVQQYFSIVMVGNCFNFKYVFNLKCIHKKPSILQMCLNELTFSRNKAV